MQDLRAPENGRPPRLSRLGPGPGRRAGRVFAVVSALLGPLVACGGEGPGSTEGLRRDSAGVEIVENPGGDRPLEWAFERVATLGGEMEGPESFTSVSPAGVDVDSAGNLYVLDRQSNRVVVFDSALTVNRTLGNEGQGPGELAGPLGLDVTSTGDVVVFDYRKRGFVRWSRDGELLAFERPEAMPFVSQFEWTPDGVLLESRGRGIMGQGEPNLSWLGFVDDEDTVRVASRTIQGPGEIQLESCGIGFTGMGRILEPDLVWSYREATGRLVVSSEAEYVIDLYDGSRRERSIRRSMEPRPVTDAMARRQVGDGMTVRTPRGEVTCEAGELIEKRGVAARLQSVPALRFAPDGALWAVRGHVGEEAPAIDVFDPTGAYLGTLPAGTPVPILVLPDGRLVAEEKDELDVERLVVYRVDRDAAG